MKKVGYLGIIGLALANIVIWPYVVEGSNLRVTFFDVGQGDAIFIQTPQGHQMLIDGGPDQKVVEKVAKVLPFWDKSLDLVVLTHADADHITGLVSVLEQYDVENVLWTGVEKETNIFAAWEQELAQERANIWIADILQTILWSKDRSARFDVVYAAKEAKEINDTSVITKLVFGETSFLFPGDISKNVEQRLLQEKLAIDADILKIPHHGSKSSSSEAFLAAVSPYMAVIQVGGQNSYGHPAFEVLERLFAMGTTTLRTDQNGDIVIEYDSSKGRTNISNY